MNFQILILLSMHNDMHLHTIINLELLCILMQVIYTNLLILFSQDLSLLLFLFQVAAVHCANFDTDVS